MPLVNYTITLPYRDVPNMRGLQPAAEVELFNGEQSARTVGIFDSGSTLTVFSYEIAELLGINDVTAGRLERVTTLGGALDIYLFDLELRLVAAGNRFAGQVGFFPVHTPRNILGRVVLFSNFEIGFRERSSQLHLRME